MFAIIKYIGRLYIYAILVMSPFLIWGVVDSSDYIHYELLGNEYRKVSLPVTNGSDTIHMYIHNYPNVTDPTSEELFNFLKNDLTNSRSYVFGSFVCIDFAIMLHDNAELSGIKSGVVTIEFYDREVGHALNVFNTTDKGLIYVDTTNDTYDVFSGESYSEYLSHSFNPDKIATVERNKLYHLESLDYNGYAEYEDMGVVSEVEIYW